MRPFKVFQTIRDDYRAIRQGSPGSRFREHADERRQRREGRFAAGRMLNLGTGIVLILLGTGIGWLPGPGGFLAILGLALIAQEVPWVADALDWMEVQLRRLLRLAKRQLGGCAPTKSQQGETADRESWRSPESSSPDADR